MQYPIPKKKTKFIHSGIIRVYAIKTRWEIRLIVSLNLNLEGAKFEKNKLAKMFKLVALVAFACIVGSMAVPVEENAENGLLKI